MKIMKKKILGILICMLMLATIPLAAGMSEDQKELARGKKTFVMGIIGYSRISLGGKYITLFCINVRYREMGVGGDHGLFRFQIVRFPNSFQGFLTTPFVFGAFAGSPL